VIVGVAAAVLLGWLFLNLFVDSDADRMVDSKAYLGVPQAVAITHADAGGSDEGLALFLRGSADSCFHVVHLACSFHPADRERILDASLRVSLTGRDTESDQRPIAWSLSPLCLPQITELRRTQRISASLKLLGIGSDQEVRTTKTDCVVQAFNELRPDPGWQFRGTRETPLRGTQRLLLVVKSLRPGSTNLHVALDARVAPSRLRRGRAVALQRAEHVLSLPAVP
jgi:hypothetical protein